MDQFERKAWGGGRRDEVKEDPQGRRTVSPELIRRQALRNAGPEIRKQLTLRIIRDDSMSSKRQQNNKGCCIIS